MKILGIECSHDDISVAILENSKIIYLDTLTQTEIHKNYGGTVPEIASREHLSLTALILEKLKKNYPLDKLDYIAYTKEPGLVGSLQIGFLFASAIAIAISKPLIPINHLVGHFYSGSIDFEILFPAIGLIVSGGHTQIIHAKNYHELKIIGETRDDAVGEVYDKIGRYLGLNYPGGSEIDKLASYTNKKDNYVFKQPKIKENFELSFSGFKTQALKIIKIEGKLLDKTLFCAAFQDSIISYLEKNLILAIKKFKPKSICLSGGVSANSLLRKRFKKLHKNAIVPNMIYTKDNGAMIAKAAEIKLLKNAKIFES